MAPPFTRLSLDDFAALLREFPWKRRITAVGEPATDGVELIL